MRQIVQQRVRLGQYHQARLLMMHLLEMDFQEESHHLELIRMDLILGRERAAKRHYQSYQRMVEVEWGGTPVALAVIRANTTRPIMTIPA